MKKLKTFLVLPIIFSATWYFVSFQIAVIIGLLYLYIISIALFYVTEKQKDKLVQIVEYITEKDGLIDPQKVDFSNIEKADDIINAIKSLNKKKSGG